MKLTLSKYAVNELIIEFEVTSKIVYDSRYKRPVWPGGTSGVTIGLGYDIGFHTPAQLQKDWGQHLRPSEIQALSKCCGKIGIVCKSLLPINVVIPFETACEVFYRVSLPKYAKQAASIYDELETLHPWEQTAIVGLVYNRGASLKGERRAEMFQLISAIKNDNDALMASIIKQMKRLWGEDQKGLRLRRDKEAEFIAAPDHQIPPEDALIIEV